MRSKIAAISVLVAIAAGLTVALFPTSPPAEKAEAASVNILNYWNFANCKWGEYHNYNDQGNLVNGGSNYKTWMRWWTNRCGNSPNERDPCGTDSNYVRWNIKAESNACYWGTDANNEDFVGYIDKELETLDWTHPVSGTSNFKVVALTGWAEMDTGGGWDWTMCGDEDPPDDYLQNYCDNASADCEQYVRVFYGADTSSVKPYVYSPQQWDFDSKGGWIYCTHAQHYVSDTDGDYCNLSRSASDTLLGDWCAFVEYLGQKTMGTTGQYTGNVIRITQWEGAYDLTTNNPQVKWDVLEEWYLMENIGIVEIRQWQSGDHTVTAKLAN